MKYSLLFLLLLQAPTIKNTQATNPQAYLLTTRNNDTTYLVLHANSTNAAVDANMQVWPSGKVKFKGTLDNATVNFWKGVFVMTPAIKKQVCQP